MTAVTRVRCACGVWLVGLPQAVAATWADQHTGPEHRVTRVTTTTPGKVARMLRRRGGAAE